MSNKTRLDVLLVERGLEQTRQRAQAMIMSGLVFVDGQLSQRRAGRGAREYPALCEPRRTQA